MLRVWVIIILSCLLNACASPEAVPVTYVDCFFQTYKTYTAAEQSEAAKELESLGPKAEVAKMMQDYGAVRVAQRACKGQ